MMRTFSRFILPLLVAAGWTSTAAAVDPARPNIILVMADDMGWGQTSYNHHPILKTPNLDAMAANGLRFDRFYAGAPVCSPTRATVLTGRTGERTGVTAHGYPLRLQEKTIAQAVRSAGYATAHFGKWHLNGLRGPGVPLPDSDPLHPGRFGFDEWLTTSNYFDLDPLLSRRGAIEEFSGDSSDVLVDQALRFVEQQQAKQQPFLVLIWYGTPHLPFRALPEDKAAFASLPPPSAEHHGELVAMDRSVGVLRQRLAALGLTHNTLLLFCSDNGGLREVQPDSVGGLRGYKNSLYEGGIRVPGIIEWPAVITTPRITDYPASTMDIFPTVADILGLPLDVFNQPIDGESLRPLLTREIGPRRQPIPFRHRVKSALVDNRYKLIGDTPELVEIELYDLADDPGETRNLAADQPVIAEHLRQQLRAWNQTVDASVAGLDYPERRVTPADPEPVSWTTASQYQPYLAEWSKRWEYEDVIKRATPASDR